MVGDDTTQVILPYVIITVTTTYGIYKSLTNISNEEIYLQDILHETHSNAGWRVFLMYCVFFQRIVRNAKYREGK